MKEAPNKEYDFWHESKVKGAAAANENRLF